ncbi:MAG TPA: thioester reductase domain-containing protein [Gemmatimonadaceae bacterium]|nr:thioester reductase domain-containing protein [Gemmatimonadaceae bacterium]
MTTALLRSAPDLCSQLRLAVATVLRISPATIDDNAPFSSLGLDSLSAAELTAEVEDLIGVAISPEAVHEYSSVSSLTRFIANGCTTDVTDFERMRADAILPPEIRPSCTARSPRKRKRDVQRILLTGATGFLGAYVLRTLLDETDAEIFCLVRRQGCGDETSRKRLLGNLHRYGLEDGPTHRVAVVDGDLARAHLGLTPQAFHALAAEIDMIIHGGAQVDWVRRYEGLRDVNVFGTREILRLACHGTPTPVHFISSLSVCYSSLGPRSLHEGRDALPLIEGLRLGYAQSKCVAESLVREAGRRGLPVSIVRPALVSGDSVGGRSNVDDLLTRFIAGCISMRAAPDLDWRVDCLPVDQVAKAIVRVARRHESGVDVLHVSAKQPRHWRECVLWMRLCGYDLDLLPYGEWIERLEREATTGHPLHPLRSFFVDEVGENGLTLPELNEETRRATIFDEPSRARIGRMGICCTTIDTALLDRYFTRYVADGVVPDVGHRYRNRSDASSAHNLDIDALRPELQRSLADRFGDPSLSIEAITLSPMGGDESIVSELTSWREGARVGLFRATLSLRGKTGNTTTRVVVKVKPADETVLEVAESVAALAGATLGREYARFRDYHGFTRSHIRELALYREPDERIRGYTPSPLALSPPGRTDRTTLVLEEIPRSALFHSAETDAPWSATRLETALAGAAQIHSLWYGRERELMAQPWLAPVRDSARLVEMRDLWRALKDHATVHSPAWRDAALVRAHSRLVEKVCEWSVPLTALSRTLVHNDFNPRNIGIFMDGEPRLSAFDWELATIGVPQRDIAELLCWTMNASAAREDVAHWLERSRLHLESATGARIDASDWELGFRAALCELIVDRLAMYAMIDRFRPQRYLPRLMRNWLMLHRHYGWDNR